MAQRVSPIPPRSPISDHYPTSQHSHQPSNGSNKLPNSAGSKRMVVTVPPWARNEQPIPGEDSYLSPTSAIGPLPRTVTISNDAFQSDIASLTSSGEDPPHSGNWWTFALPRRKSTAPVPEDHPDLELNEDQRYSSDMEKENQRRDQKGKTPMKEKNRASWIFGYALSQEKTREKEPTIAEPPEDEANVAGPSNASRRTLKKQVSHTLRLDVPLPSAPFTLAQTKTPGWDSPWAPHKYKIRHPGDAHVRSQSADAIGSSSLARGASSGRMSTSSSSSPPSTRANQGGYWKQKRRKWRSFCLYNNYVPLLFRILNLSFTSATLALAVSIRAREKDLGVRGSLGSSPTIAIIFSPITILHVLIAIYLEYFGRPLGLWRTSAKLAHTLVEVLFICAWAASLSLCFDNYYTSPLECSSRALTNWWNKLPPVPNPLEDRPDGRDLGRALCHQQIALICLVFLSLTFYCSNLVISLFRIIEKVKYHSGRLGRV